jgi:L-galactono-1,4-lactone dehydrogenase
VTVQAGARVQAVADALKPYGLTLRNYASVREQQVGGFVQVRVQGRVEG